MSINYTYEIVNVDTANRVMEIVYTATGQPMQHIGARLPYEGETLEDVVRAFAPVAFWQSLAQPVVAPVVGTSGVLSTANEQPQNNATVSEMALTTRQYLLKESDWTQLPDVPLSAEKRQAWAAYRQELRDITAQPGYPENIVWPTPV